MTVQKEPLLPHRTTSLLQPVLMPTPPLPLPSERTEELARKRRRVGKMQKREWTRRVAERDPVLLLDGRTCINRAYWKMREMAVVLEKGRREAPRSIFHMAEAPGGFAQATSHLYPGSRIKTCSLQNEGSIRMDRRVAQMQVPLPCAGDLRKEEAVDALLKLVGEGKVDLVTGDGGAEVANLDAEEQESTLLLLAQAGCGLRMQAEGGSMVLKFFEGSTKPLRDLLCLLRGVYAETMLYKPVTSRCANSERYMLCRGLREAKRARRLGEELGRVVEKAMNGGGEGTEGGGGGGGGGEWQGQGNSSRKQALYVHSLLDACDEEEREEVCVAFDRISQTQAESIDDLVEDRKERVGEKREKEMEWLVCSGAVEVWHMAKGDRGGVQGCGLGKRGRM